MTPARSRSLPGLCLPAEPPTGGPDVGPAWLICIARVRPPFSQGAPRLRRPKLISCTFWLPGANPGPSGPWQLLPARYIFEVTDSVFERTPSSTGCPRFCKAFLTRHSADSALLFGHSGILTFPASVQLVGQRPHFAVPLGVSRSEVMEGDARRDTWRRTQPSLRPAQPTTHTLSVMGVLGT